jgi:hypothetical protein
MLLLRTARFSNSFFIITSNAARYALTIPASGSTRHQQEKGQFSEFHLTEVGDISAKAVITLNS